MGKKIVSVRQLELLIGFMERHNDLACGRVRSKEGRALSQKLWRKCARILNAHCDRAFSRSPKDWNKFYNDYKCRLKTKIQRSKEQKLTGGGLQKMIVLSKCEERLSSLLELDQSEASPVQHDPLVDLKSQTIESESEESHGEEWNVILDSSTSKMAQPTAPAHPSNSQLSRSTADISSKPRATGRTPPSTARCHPVASRANHLGETEYEKAEAMLIDLEKSRLELQRAEVLALVERNALERERIVVEKEKVSAINNLASAAWAFVNRFIEQSTESPT